MKISVFAQKKSIGVNMTIIIQKTDDNSANLQVDKLNETSPATTMPSECVSLNATMTLQELFSQATGIALVRTIDLDDYFPHSVVSSRKWHLKDKTIYVHHNLLITFRDFCKPVGVDVLLHFDMIRKTILRSSRVMKSMPAIIVTNLKSPSADNLACRMGDITIVTRGTLTSIVNSQHTLTLSDFHALPEMPDQCLAAGAELQRLKHELIALIKCLGGN
jgi:hypothetical protein